MADDLITFDENISRDLLKMRDEWRRRGTSSKRTRRQPIMDATGGMMLVGFEIVSADNCGTCTATATVALNCGTTPTLDSYDQFTVYDPKGCHLNEPVEALTGRFGWAVYGTRLVDGACPGLPETGWWILYLCGLEDSCQ